jgi:hypothetical protein
MRRLKKGQFDFEWIFAIIAGAAILILAVYGAVKIGNTMRYQTDTEVGKQISILTDPLQAGFASGSFGKISFSQETRINNICFDGGFGRNAISTSTKSNVGEKWQIQGAETSITNKYIFSSNLQNSSLSQGKDFYVFSKPFLFPYKVADLTFLLSKNYCFTETPKEIGDEIKAFGIPLIKIENCSAEDIEVCFGSNNCDVNVHGTCNTNCNSVYDEGYVEKGSSRLYFVGSLVYGAIFSDRDTYNCDVKRLLYRSGRIAEILSEKANLMNSGECNTNLGADLSYFSGFALNASSSDLIGLNQVAKDIQKREEVEVCGIWA